MILVVDDDKSIRLSLKLILERNEFEVVLAEEPHAAIQGLLFACIHKTRWNNLRLLMHPRVPPMVKLVHDFIDHPLGISPALLVSFDVGEFVAFPFHLPRCRVNGIETDVALFALVKSRVRVRKDFSVWTHFFWRLF